ncbi:MAG: DUF559 domain-containing protein [Chloroflexota bacterium]
MHERAKQLQRNLTPCEKILWKELRTNKLSGLHFRRQQIIDSYIADFYCHQHALIVEVDGCIHELQEEYLVARGFRVLHVTNDDVKKNLALALRKILEACF